MKCYCKYSVYLTDSNEIRLAGNFGEDRKTVLPSVCLSTFLCDTLRETPQYNMLFVQISEILIHYIDVYISNKYEIYLHLASK